ncbi:hypothetical protein AURANDRAFT_68621, partial [Aureococcus anophagefferens]
QTNGLRTIKCVDPSQFTRFVDSATGGEIPKEAIYDPDKLLKYCTPLSKKQRRSINNYCGTFLSMHSTSLLNPQEFNLCGDGPSDPNLGFYDIRVVNKDLENKTLVFPAYDLLVYTAPCYRNTPLRLENDLPVPTSAAVFVEEQRKFVKLTSPNHVLNEHVPTRPECHDEHDSLMEFFSSAGYNTATNMLDACNVGDRTSRFRWFCLASKKTITSFDTVEKIGINKAKLRGIPGYYLYPANYHPLYAKNLKSTSTSVIMLQVNGKPNKLFSKSLIQTSQGEGVDTTRSDPRKTSQPLARTQIVDSHETSASAPTNPVQEPEPPPTRESPPSHPIGSPSQHRPFQKKLTFQDVTPPRIRHTPFSTPVTEEISESQRMSPPSGSDFLESAEKRLTRMFNFYRIRNSESPFVETPKSPESTETIFSPGSPQPESVPAGYRHPKHGDYINLRNREGGWNTKLKVIRGKPHKMFSETTPGLEVDPKNISVVEWEEGVKRAVDAVYIWDYWNASSGQLPDNYCKSFEYNLCGDGPVNTDVLKHHGSDNSSPSSRAKLNVAKLLYKQGMAKRATRLVQDHHRRGLSPPVPSCQTMVDVDPSFATPNAPSADWSRLSRVVELLWNKNALHGSSLLAYDPGGVER